MQCSRCRIDKPNTDFYTHCETGKPMRYCKVCLKEYNKERRDSEKTKQYNQAYYKKIKKLKIANPSQEDIDIKKRKHARAVKRYNKRNLAKICYRNQEYYRKNRDKILEKQKEYYAENRERMLERQRMYYEENKEKILDKHRDYQKEYQRMYRRLPVEKINLAKRADKKAFTESAKGL